MDTSEPIEVPADGNDRSFKTSGSIITAEDWNTLVGRIRDLEDEVFAAGSVQPSRDKSSDHPPESSE